MSLRKAALLAGAGAFLLIPAFASADFSWDFNTVISGDTPGGSAPWANLTGTQNGSGVDFTLTFNSFVGAGSATEFLKQLDLAYTGGLDTGHDLNTGSASIVGFDFGSLTDAGLHFDVKMDFSTPNNANRVTPGESVSFTITNVDADNFTSGLLHINGTPGNEGSGKVAPGPVPEPASMAALGIGAMGLLARRRRNKK
jgi:hypothetical protein